MICLLEVSRRHPSHKLDEFLLLTHSNPVSTVHCEGSLQSAPLASGDRHEGGVRMTQDNDYRATTTSVGSSAAMLWSRRPTFDGALWRHPARDSRRRLGLCER